MVYLYEFFSKYKAKDMFPHLIKKPIEAWEMFCWIAGKNVCGGIFTCDQQLSIGVVHEGIFRDSMFSISS